MKNYNKCKSIQLIMIHPTGFSDSENIIIIDNVPYFHYTSSTYKDKLKNGLSLEYVFEQEYMITNKENIKMSFLIVRILFFLLLKFSQKNNI